MKDATGLQQALPTLSRVIKKQKTKSLKNYMENYYEQE
jgi:hypothetical protein